MSDQEKFINIFYNRGMHGFLKKYGLRLTPQEFFSVGIHPKSFCYSMEIKEDFLKKCIVVGGPCIKDCENAITIEAVYEIFIIIRTAKLLNTKGVIFIGLQEEILQYGKKQSYNYLRKNIDRVIKALSNFLAYNDITIIDTREQSYNSLMKKFIEKTNNFLNIKKINTIFEFGNRKYKAHNQSWINATKRIVIAHVPSFLYAYLGNKNNKKILAVENTQQIKIIKLAQLIESSENGPYQVNHLPVPGVSGSERMYRSPHWNKVYLNEMPDELLIKQLLAPKEVFDFWMEMFEELKLDNAPAHLYELMSTLNNIIYEKNFR